MKRLKLFVLAALVSGAVVAQSQQEVKDLLNEYSEAMTARQWQKSLDYVYPALFDVVPREMMENAISSTFNDTSVVRMGFKEMELLQVSDIYNEESFNYSFADYSMIMTMTLMGEKTDEEISSFASIMEGQFGEGSVEVDGKTLFITTSNKMAVIKKDGENKLYMLEIKPELKEIMSSFMSDTFMTRAFES